ILKIDFLLTPHLFEDTNCGSPRLRVAALQLVDRALRHADVPPKLRLAPIKDCSRQAYLRGKGLPLEPHDLPEPARVHSEMNGHYLPTFIYPNENPPAVSRRGLLFRGP